MIASSNGLIRIPRVLIIPVNTLIEHWTMYCCFGSDDLTLSAYSDLGNEFQDLMIAYRFLMNAWIRSIGLPVGKKEFQANGCCG